MTTEKINIPTALEYFGRELDMIQDSTLQAFFYNALAVAPQSFHDDKEIQEFDKKAFHILKGILDSKNVGGAVRDALLGTVLLCDIMINEMPEDMKHLHGVAVRKYLEKHQVNEDVQQGLWENIVRAIEGHNSNRGASIMLEAKPGTAEHEVAQAFNLARLPFLILDWEVIYNEGNDKETN